MTAEFDVGVGVGATKRESHAAAPSKNTY